MQGWTAACNSVLPGAEAESEAEPETSTEEETGDDQDQTRTPTNTTTRPVTSESPFKSEVINNGSGSVKNVSYDNQDPTSLGKLKGECQQLNLEDVLGWVQGVTSHLTQFSEYETKTTGKICLIHSTANWGTHTRPRKKN
jgi:hypothetical protein